MHFTPTHIRFATRALLALVAPWLMRRSGLVLTPFIVAATPTYKASRLDGG